MNVNNNHMGPKSDGTNPEIVRVRPSSGEKQIQPENSFSDQGASPQGSILTRNVPNNQQTTHPTFSQGYPTNMNPNQLTGGHPGQPTNFPQQNFPQGPHQNQLGHPQLMRPNMGGQFGTPGYPGHPGQMNPGFPMSQQPGMPGGPGGPQLYPGNQGGPQFGGQNMNQQPTFNRFQHDNRALQNITADDGSGGAYGSSQKCWGECTGWCGTWIPCLCCCPNPYKTVPEGFTGIIMRFGKFFKIIGPGMHYLIPDLDTLVLIDKREKVVELKQQSVVSKDNTSFRVDAVLYYKVTNTYKSKFGVLNLEMALRDLAATTLRNAVGRMTIQQFLEQKEHFADQIEMEISNITEAWGAKVIRVLVQDVHLPPEFRNSFSTSAVAKRISEAQVITSKAEVEVARLMRDAADALSTDAAFQIRYIDALENITMNANPKMIFFPADYTNVGTANDDLLSQMTEEMDSLLKKR